MGTEIRFASPRDAELVLHLIRRLAEYEGLSDQVIADRAILEESLSVGGPAECLLAFRDGTPVGYALFFHSFSTFLGRAGLYLEDLFVEEAFRGLGIGKALLSRVARIAEERGCRRLEWACLDWNAPGIAFYKGLGAVPMEEWTTYRLTGEALHSLAEEGGHGELLDR